MNRTAQLVCVFAGPFFIVCFLIGSVWLARLFPPAIRPQWSAVRVQEYFAMHQTKIMIGLVFTTVAYGLMATWGVGMATQTRRKEGAFPTWTYLQLVNMAAGTAQIVVMGGIFAVADYRPGHFVAGHFISGMDPHITQTMYDLGWLLLLGTWMTFTFWSVCLGLQILTDKTESVFPRWSGYVSIAAGIGYMPGSGVWFMKHGAWGWEGAIALWWVFLEFGGWVLLFTYLTYRNIKRGYVHEQELAPASAVAAT
ncbi:MAG TPA: hypothetical protein VHX88_04525 [Solirubrobacteraceae bacterium]|jgi:hypothetical protein|nr:hypothetical protein [Solirubrobacteraceae bacterium]